MYSTNGKIQPAVSSELRPEAHSSHWSYSLAAYKGCNAAPVSEGSAEANPSTSSSSTPQLCSAAGCASSGIPACLEVSTASQGMGSVHEHMLGPEQSSEGRGHATDDGLSSLPVASTSSVAALAATTDVSISSSECSKAAVHGTQLPDAQGLYECSGTQAGFTDPPACEVPGPAIPMHTLDERVQDEGMMETQFGEATGAAVATNSQPHLPDHSENEQGFSTELVDVSSANSCIDGNAQDTLAQPQNTAEAQPMDLDAEEEEERSSATPPAAQGAEASSAESISPGVDRALPYADTAAERVSALACESNGTQAAVSVIPDGAAGYASGMSSAQPLASSTSSALLLEAPLPWAEAQSLTAAVQSLVEPMEDADAALSAPAAVLCLFELPAHAVSVEACAPALQAASAATAWSVEQSLPTQQAGPATQAEAAVQIELVTQAKSVPSQAAPMASALLSKAAIIRAKSLSAQAQRADNVEKAEGEVEHEALMQLPRSGAVKLVHARAATNFPISYSHVRSAMTRGAHSPLKAAPAPPLGASARSLLQAGGSRLLSLMGVARNVKARQPTFTASGSAVQAGSSVGGPSAGGMQQHAGLHGSGSKRLWHASLHGGGGTRLGQTGSSQRLAQGYAAQAAGGASRLSEETQAVEASQPSLETQLREWRSCRARSLRKRPEALLPDMALARVASRVPTLITQLAALPEVSKYIVATYGNDILNIVRNYAFNKAERKRKRVEAEDAAYVQRCMQARDASMHAWAAHAAYGGSHVPPCTDAAAAGGGASWTSTAATGQESGMAGGLDGSQVHSGTVELDLDAFFAPRARRPVMKAEAHPYAAAKPAPHQWAPAAAAGAACPSRGSWHEHSAGKLADSSSGSYQGACGPASAAPEHAVHAGLHTAGNAINGGGGSANRAPVYPRCDATTGSPAGASLRGRMLHSMLAAGIRLTGSTEAPPQAGACGGMPMPASTTAHRASSPHAAAGPALPHSGRPTSPAAATTAGCSGGGSGMTYESPMHTSIGNVGDGNDGVHAGSRSRSTTPPHTSHLPQQQQQQQEHMQQHAGMHSEGQQPASNTSDQQQGRGSGTGRRRQQRRRSQAAGTSSTTAQAHAAAGKRRSTRRTASNPSQQATIESASASTDGIGALPPAKRARRRLQAAGLQPGASASAAVSSCATGTGQAGEAYVAPVQRHGRALALALFPTPAQLLSAPRAQLLGLLLESGLTQHQLQQQERARTRQLSASMPGCTGCGAGGPENSASAGLVLAGLAEARRAQWEVARVLACRTLPYARNRAAAVLRVHVNSEGASRKGVGRSGSGGGTRGGAYSKDALRAAYKRLSLVLHPDKNGSLHAADAFKDLSTAAALLLG